MSSILLTGPAVEPLSLDDARSFLRVENGDDDPLIAALIVSARMHVEGQGKTALISQDWRIVLDCWPHHGRIAVRPGPLKALKAARVYVIVTANRRQSTRRPSCRIAALQRWLSCPGPCRSPADRSRHRARCHGRFRRCRGRRARTAAAGDPSAGRALVREPRPGGRRRQKHGAALDRRRIDLVLPGAIAVTGQGI